MRNKRMITRKIVAASVAWALLRAAKSHVATDSGNSAQRKVEPCWKSALALKLARLAGHADQFLKRRNGRFVLPLGEVGR